MMNGNCANDIIIIHVTNQQQLEIMVNTSVPGPDPISSRSSSHWKPNIIQPFRKSSINTVVAKTAIIIILYQTKYIMHYVLQPVTAFGYGRWAPD